MSVTSPLLSRAPRHNAPTIPLLAREEEIALMQGRVHEASGPARRTFALWLAARTTGPVIWIAPSWSTERLNADGICPWIDPARLILVTPRRVEDLLWTMEEVLRVGAVALAVVDLPDLPGLTPVRRMHLAAESGGRTGAHLPLGLLLTPGEGGAAGVETRWHLRARHRDGIDGWRLDRVRARTAPHKSWSIGRPHADGELRIKTA
jgi:protein ImuA